MQLKQLLKNFWNEEDGQSLSEYGLILALVAVVAIATLTTLGTELKTMFSDIAEDISDAMSGG